MSIRGFFTCDDVNSSLTSSLKAPTVVVLGLSTNASRFSCMEVLINTFTLSPVAAAGVLESEEDGAG